MVSTMTMAPTRTTRCRSPGAVRRSREVLCGDAISVQSSAMAVGRVNEIFIAGGPKAPPQAVEQADAIAGVGLSGDRYAERTGTWWKPEKQGQHLTLIEAETV